MNDLRHKCHQMLVNIYFQHQQISMSVMRKKEAWHWKKCKNKQVFSGKRTDWGVPCLFSHNELRFPLFESCPSRLTFSRKKVWYKFKACFIWASSNFWTSVCQSLSHFWLWYSGFLDSVSLSSGVTSHEGLLWSPQPGRVISWSLYRIRALIFNFLFMSLSPPWNYKPYENKSMTILFAVITAALEQKPHSWCLVIFVEWMKKWISKSESQGRPGSCPEGAHS